MLFTSASAAISALIVTGAASFSIHQEWRGVTRATIAGEFVYTLGNAQRPEYLKPRTYGGGFVSVHRAPINAFKVGSNFWQTSIWNEWHASPHSPLRWQFSSGKFHVGSFAPLPPNAGPRYGSVRVFSQDDLPFCGTLPKDSRQTPERNADNRTFQSHIAFGAGIGPYDTHFDDGRVLKSKVRPQVFFDFLTYKTVGYEIFVAADGKLTRSCIEPRQNNRDVEWAEKESWTTGWTEPFYVAEKGDELFFVTHSGKLFYVTRNSKPGTLLGDIWKDKPPIQALIRDADSKKSYAFTKDEFFELTGEPKPKPHTLDLRRVVNAAPALEAAVKCSKLIREPKR